MRADGGYHKGLYGRVNDGTSGREGIGGGTGGASYDQAVGAIAADKGAVNVELKLDHAGKSALIDHHVVQHTLRIRYFPGAFELGADHHTLAERKTALYSVIEGRMKFFQGETGKETQAAHVDRENGNPT